MKVEVIEKVTNRKAQIFDIQRFSLHDGPGIRTTVFLKGCPLQCLWCSNPESQSAEPDLLVRDIRCTRCGDCVTACPESCISLTPGVRRKLEIDWQRCTRCFKCVEVCTVGSLTIAGCNQSIEDIVKILVKDRVFYDTSGGGVTLSGGEPLQQIEAVLALLASCKREKLHTTLDTSGFANWKDIEATLPYVDLYLYDLKILDSNKHKELTSVNNRTILKNLERLAGRSRLWIRIPLIAEVNDSIEQIREVAILAKRVKAEQISLLPYHEGGISKCIQIGKSYGFHGASEPGREHIEELTKVINAEGVKVVVGA